MMKIQILSVTPSEPSEIIEFEGMDWNLFSRSARGHWMCCMNSSWEEMGEFEEGERLYQERKKRDG